MIIRYRTDSLCVLDVSDELPAHPSKTYIDRDEKKIDWIIAHHTGGSVKPGMKGILSTHRYCQTPKIEGGRGWAGVPYHFWLPYQMELDGHGRFVLYLLNDTKKWTWHTGGKSRGKSINRHGLSVAMQGCFPSKAFPNRQPPDKAQITNYPSVMQLAALPLLLEWAADRFCGGNPESLTTHSIMGKPACPGSATEEIVRQTKQVLFGG